MQKTKLVVENICPQCESTACAQFMSVDGQEVHINCLDCNKVYASKMVASGNLQVRKWREMCSFVRL
jgi:hypothetical protein